MLGDEFLNSPPGFADRQSKAAPDERLSEIA